jgi:hypothetical protein
MMTPRSMLTDEVLQWATPRRVRAVQCYAWHAQALAAIGRGDFEEAYQRASKISPAGTIASHLYVGQDVLLDLVEAAVHTGRHTEASAHVAAMQESNIAARSSRLALVAGGSAAIAAATDDSAIELFEEAPRRSRRRPMVLPPGPPPTGLPASGCDGSRR